MSITTEGKRIYRLLPAAAVLLAILAVPARAAIPGQNPDWPCQQRFVPALTAGTFWNGPLPDKADWHADARVAAQVATLDQPHVHIEPPIDLAVGVDRDDVWVVQPRGRFGLPAEPLHERIVLRQLRREHLDSNSSVCGRVMSAPNFTHTAATQ